MMKEYVAPKITCFELRTEETLAAGCWYGEGCCAGGAKACYVGNLS